MSTFQTDNLHSGMTVRSGNRLLASLPFEEYLLVAPHLRTVGVKHRQVVYKQDEVIHDVLFPSAGALSLVKTLQDGQSAEVATIGAEGVVGASVFFGQPVSDCEVVVQVPGPGVEMMKADAFNREMERRGTLYRQVLRYNQALMCQIMQAAICNGVHSAEQRCCRWLLMMHDRSGGDEVPLTHEMLSTMLGVRRPTITIVVAGLQAAGLIQCRRGAIRIGNRAGLEAASCECYQLVKATSERLLQHVHAT